MANRVYPIRPDLPDHRDRLFVAPPSKGLTSVDLRPEMPPVYDQGQLGACSSMAIAASIQFLTKTYEPSRLFIYYNERLLQGTVAQDSGAYLRYGMKATQQYGACPETDWPYDIAKFAEAPPAPCYKEGLPDRVHSYYKIPVDANCVAPVKAALEHSIPVIIGIVVYPSFESQYTAETGIVMLPALNEKPLGGHAILIVGFDDSKNAFIVRNSWGTDWGMEGYFYLPYNYVNNPQLTMSLWVIQTV